MSTNADSSLSINSEVLLIVEQQLKSFGIELESSFDHEQIDKFRPVLESSRHFLRTLRQLVELSEQVLADDPGLAKETMKSIRLALSDIQSSSGLLSDLYSTCQRFVENKDHRLTAEFLKLLRVFSQVDGPEKSWSKLLQFVRHLQDGPFSGDYCLRCFKTLRENSDLQLDFLSYGQIQSKLFLVEELERLVPGVEDKFIVLLGGWYGLFAELLFSRNPESKGRVFSVDQDSKANQASEKLNQGLVRDSWRFKALTMDIHDIDFKFPIWRVRKANSEIVEIPQSPDVYINTSCEHIDNFERWIEQIPEGTVLALQSNDAEGFEGHINCVSSMEEFKGQAQLSAVYSQAVLKFKGYRRFVLIGVK